MFKKVLILFVLCLSLVMTGIADAKGGGSSGGGGARGGSFSSASRASISVSRPSPSVSVSKPSGISSVSKPSGVTSSGMKSGSFGAATATKVNTGAYAKQGNPVPAASSVGASSAKGTSTTSTPTVRYVTKNTTIYHNPPAYVHNTYPAFGMWETLFLVSMMNNNHAWMYNHQNDPGVQAYMKEMREMEKDNAELKVQMDAMQKSMDEMKAQNATIDENYMPDDVEKIDINQETNNNDSAQSAEEQGTSVFAKVFIVVMCIIGLFVIVCFVMALI